eukprot:SAG31_NODE_1076_length_10037_cov_8.357818_12_plen_73_part_00
MLGARVDVEFAPGPEDAFEAGPFEGRVTKLRKRSFSVHFDSDGTDASVRAVTFSFLCNYSRNAGLSSREIRH